MNVSGIVILDKACGVTSQKAVTAVKRLFGAEKAGHTGTLDPMATGVLPILLGRAVKASEYMLTSEKHYSATMRLGITTDTEDVTGEILSRSDIIPDEAEVMAAVNGFIGSYMQTPPMYSAIRVGGKRLMELARKGVSIEREAREVSIYSLTAKRLSSSDYRLDVHCSKGTYIRTLCADIGKTLGCGAVMAALRRTEAAGFTLDAAHSAEELERLSPEERTALIIPVERVFEKYRLLRLDPFNARLAKCGQALRLSRLGIEADCGERLRLSDKNGFFALGEVTHEDGEIKVKPIKQFDIK